MALRNPTLEDIQEILGRALLDADFRNKLIKDPVTLLKTLGFQLSDNAKAFFLALDDQAFVQVAQDVENRLGGRAVVGAWI